MSGVAPYMTSNVRSPCCATTSSLKKSSTGVWHYRVYLYAIHSTALNQVHGSRECQTCRFAKTALRNRLSRSNDGSSPRITLGGLGPSVFPRRARFFSDLSRSRFATLGDLVDVPHTVRTVHRAFSFNGFACLWYVVGGPLRFVQAATQIFREPIESFVNKSDPFINSWRKASSNSNTKWSAQYIIGDSWERLVKSPSTKLNPWMKARSGNPSQLYGSWASSVDS